MSGTCQIAGRSSRDDHRDRLIDVLTALEVNVNVVGRLEKDATPLERIDGSEPVLRGQSRVLET